jgi:hypothetical protein
MLPVDSKTKGNSGRLGTIVETVFSGLVVAIAVAVVYLAFTLVPSAAPPAPAPVAAVVPAMAQIHLGPIRGSATTFSLDRLSVGGKLLPTATHDARPSAITISRGDAFAVTGWAVDAGARRAASAVVAQIGTDLTVSPVTIPRPDVDSELRLPPGANSGFSMTVPTSDLEPGPHTLRFLMVAADGSTMRDTGKSIAFTASAARALLHPIVTLDSINGEVIGTKPHRIHVGTSSWTVQGWAIGDVASSIPFAALHFFIDKKPAATVRRGDPRPDVARVMNVPTLVDSGFTANFDRALTPGDHTLSVSLETPDGRIIATDVSLPIAP